MTTVREPLRLSQLLVWIGLATCGLFIVLFGGYRTIAVIEAKIFFQAAAVLVLGGWLILALWRPRWRPNSPLLVPVALAASAYLLSALLSQRPRLGIEATIGGLGFALTFVFLSRVLQEDWLRQRVGSLLIIATSFVALGYHIEVVVEWIRWWQLVGFVTIPPLRPSWASLSLGAPNTVAAFLLLAGPLATVVLARRQNGRGPAILLGLLILSALFLTGARSAYLAVAFALSVVAFATCSRARVRASLQSGLALIAHRPVLLAVPIAILIAAAAFVPALLHRFAQGGDAVRLDLWRSAFDIFLAHPITGSGPGTWVQMKVLANPPAVANLIFSNAHNMYVQTAAELGLLGIGALIFLVWQVGRRLTGGLAAGGEIRLTTIAIVAGLSGFGAHALFDTLVNLPAIAMLLIGLVAWADSAISRTDRRSASQSHSWRRMAGPLPIVASLAGIAIAVPVLVSTDLAWIEFEKGRSAALGGDLPSAAEHYAAAYRGDPDFPLYAIQLASVTAALGDFAEARALLAEAIVDDPVAVNQIGLATLDAELGNLDAALSGAATAVALGTREATVALNAGLIAERGGRQQLALDYFASAVEWNPAIAGSTFWVSPDRGVAQSAVIELAVSRMEPLDAALVLAYAGRRSEAEQLLDGQPASRLKDICTAVVVWRAGDAPAALATLGRILDANPLDWGVAAWMSRIARQSGDMEASVRYARWALVVQGDSAPSVLLEYSVIPAPQQDPDSGLPRSYPTGVYSRPRSPELLIPLVVQIGLR